VIGDYAESQFTGGTYTRQVFRRGTGPAAIIIHEMPGLHPLVFRFADRVAAAGMTVFLPSLFGTPGKEISRGYYWASVLKAVCIQREFAVWASDRSSPIVDWLRALARYAHAECGGRGVGAVGMCFTGNFALAMMTEPSVVAPVLSQPSLPSAIFRKRRKADLHASPEEISCARRRFNDEDLSMIGLRFRGDHLSPQERFDRLTAEFGDRFEPIVLEDADAQPGPIPPHCVLTMHLVDTPGSPTKRAEERVIEFLSNATRGGPTA
jgi:dienelactone hydrolase